jgi:general secretion pathway protein H
MPTSTPRPSSEASGSGSPAGGFTLLEVAIILFIVAVAATFVIPRLKDTDSAALSASAARLATTARYLYEEAAFRQRPMRLNLDLDDHAYWVTVLNDDPDAPEFVPDSTPLAAPVRLPAAVAFADAVLPALGTLREGLIFAQFFPEGYADALVVHLHNRRNQYATLAIEPLTGRTRVSDGYHDVEQGHDQQGRDPGQRAAPDRPEDLRAPR